MSIFRAAAVAATLLALPATAAAFVVPVARPDVELFRLEPQAAKKIFVPVPRPQLEPGDWLLTYPERLALARAARSAQKGRWREVAKMGERIKNPVARKVAHWIWLNGPARSASWAELRDFIYDNPKWPKLNAIRAEMERRMPPGLEPQLIVDLLSTYRPLTGAGILRLAEAYFLQGRTNEAISLAIEAWREKRLSRSDQRRLLRKFGGYVTALDHSIRLDNLIWDRHWTDARHQLQRVEGVHRSIGEARIKLGTRQRGVDRAINHIPAADRDHPGLVYERVRWKRRSGYYVSALDLLISQTDFSGRPDRWWWETKVQIRHLLSTNWSHKDQPPRQIIATTAHDLASRYNHLDGTARAEATWLAGWLALEFLDKSDLALQHFREMREGVSQPISIARAEYWSAKAAQSLNSREQEATYSAEVYLEAASAYPETYYGQIARRELGLETALPPVAQASPEVVDRLRESEMGMAIRMLVEAGGTDYVRPFVLRLADTARYTEEIVALHELCLELGMPRLAITAAKRGVRRGHRAPQLLFPVPPASILPRPEDSKVPLPMVLAVANQESAFDREAVSHAGARGLMQLMPATARHYARLTGVSYRLSDLTEDPDYNVRLGQAVLADMLERFDDELPLALAAYNAGKRRVKNWVQEYGDPRKGEISMLNWVELVPIAETRNYVQRVMEGLEVYESLLQ